MLWNTDHILQHCALRVTVRYSSVSPTVNLCYKTSQVYGWVNSNTEGQCSIRSTVSNKNVKKTTNHHPRFHVPQCRLRICRSSRLDLIFEPFYDFHHSMNALKISWWYCKWLRNETPAVKTPNVCKPTIHITIFYEVIGMRNYLVPTSILLLLVVMSTLHWQ